MKEILMKCGNVMLVSDEDYEFASQNSWHPDKDGYAVTKIGGRSGKLVRFHRVIMNAKEGQFLDHINRNRLDNRRENLRFASKSENQWNRGSSRANKTGFKAVFWRKECTMRPYRVAIGVKGKQIYLGSFSTPEEAHAAYKEASNRHHGEFSSHE